MDGHPVQASLVREVEGDGAPQAPMSRPVLHADALPSPPLPPAAPVTAMLALLAMPPSHAQMPRCQVTLAAALRPTGRFHK